MWLGIPSVSQQLVAVGYYPLGLQQAAAEALAAWDDAKQDMSNSSRRGTLVQKLQAAGAALASVAVRCVCNNPWCGNVGGATELGIVSGKGHKCNGCRAAYYCSPRCQRQSWPEHMPVSQALAAAAMQASIEAHV